MSSLNTTPLNASLKAQQLSGKKALQDTAQAAGNTGFENLFATALSQRGSPQAKLSQINEELQEALGSGSKRKSEENKKPFNPNQNSTEANGNAYGMSTSTLAQANMWAQRDWAQSNRSDNAVAVGSSQIGTNSAQNTNRSSELAAKDLQSAAGTSAPAQAQSDTKPPPPSDTETSSKATADAGSSQPGEPQANAEATTGQNNTAEASGQTSSAEAKSAANPADQAASLVKQTTASTELQAATTADPAIDPSSIQSDALNPTVDGNTIGTNRIQNSGTNSELNATTPNDSGAQPQSTSANATPEVRGESISSDQGLRLAGDGKPDSLRPQLDPAINASQANRPEVALAAVTAQALQAGGKTRSLKAGDEILATSGINNSSTASTQANAGIGLAAMATGRTGSAAEATIKTPVNQPGFVKELGAQVQWAVGKNLSTVDIRLNAGQLGADAGNMNMRIIQRGQDIQLVIRTQDEATAGLLNQTIAGLKETMAQNGLQLTQVQIQSANNPNNPNAAGNSNLANAQQQAQQQAGQSGSHSGGRSGRDGGSQGNAGQEGQTNAVEPARRNRSNGNIDLVA